MKRKILENAKKNKSLVGVRTQKLDIDESIIGFVINVENPYFTINEIDENGVLIGNTTIPLNDIVNIDIDDRYQKRLKFIYDNNSILSIDKRVTIWKEESELLPHLKNLVEENKIATFYFDEENYVIGKVIEFDNDNLLIKCIGSEGDFDGISCYSVANLVGLRYDSLEEQKITLLHENKILFYDNET